MSIYLDHAATSFPKPETVLQAVQEWYSSFGVSSDRGDGPATHDVHTRVSRVRRTLATACGVPTDRLVFTSGATKSLNLFLHGFLRPGDRVLTTRAEHSSVVRPLHYLAEHHGIRFDIVDCDSNGYSDPEQVGEALDRNGPYRLLVFSHASNVTGAVQDAALLCKLARQHDCTTLVDASQSAGVLPLDFGADAVAASAHKSMLGPPGLGFLAVQPAVTLVAVEQGGTGTAFALDRQPDEWPQCLESGTPNTPAIFGLDAALEWLSSQDKAKLLAQGLDCIDQLRAALPEDAVVHSPVEGRRRLPVLSFNLPELDPAEAAILLATHGIQARCGYHCAPWIHETLGSQEAGTIRVSPGPFTTAADVLQVPTALGCG